MMQAKVLIIEDDKIIQSAFAAILRGKVIILSAFTIEQAEELFESNPDIHIIAVDGEVPRGTPTISLVVKIRKTFTGPMIAISNHPDNRAKLLRAGCDYETAKELLPSMLREILSSQAMQKGG